MKFPLRILHLEDDPNDAELVKQILVAEGIACDLVRVETRSDFITSIEQGVFDLILADYSLPQFDGLSALVIAREKCPDVPFILVSGALGEELAIETLKKGATDYVLKNNLSRLLSAINRALHEVEGWRERKRAEEKIRQNTRHLQDLLDLHRMADSKEKSVLDHILDTSVRSLQSEFSFFGTMSADEAVMTIHAWSKGAMEQCAITEKPMHFPIAEAGLWGEVVRQRRPVVVNDYYATIEYKKGYPKGHVPIKRFLSVPVFSAGKIVAVAAVANKMSEYDASDVNILTSLLNEMWNLIERKWAEETIEKLRHQNELILNSAGEGILGLDLQGNHTFVNPAAARILGYEIEELIGRHSHTIWHHTRADGSLYPEEECPIYVVLRHGAVNTNDDEVFLRKNGTSFPVRYSSTPILEDGNIVGAVVTFRDITERKQVEEALRETRDYLEKLLNYANAPIVVWDPRFTITGFNHAFERLTGHKDKEVIGKNLHMLFPEANREESLKKIAPTSSSEYGESVEIPILCKDGSIRIVLWSSANIYAKDARTLIATIAQGQDITERKIAEEKIKRFNRLYSMLYEINEVIIRIRGQKELFRKACQIAVEKGLFRMTWIEHIDPDSHSLKSIVHGEYGEEYLDKIRISIKEAPEGLLPISTAIREGKYIICNDFKDASCIHPCRDEAIKCGYYSMAAFPLQIGTHIIGAINFYSGEPHFFDDEEISTLTQLTGDISFALEHIEQQEQLQKRIEDLEKFYEMGIERELRIKEQKKEIKLLEDELSNYKKDNSSERA